MTMAKDRQIMLFSATMPDRIKALAHRYMTQVQHITIKTENITLDFCPVVIPQISSTCIIYL